MQGERQQKAGKEEKLKTKMHERLNAITANIRGIHTSGKRQILANEWEQEGIDIALLTEVQRNIGGMEKGGPCGKYTVFFSTGICPEKSEEQENRREQRALEAKRKKGGRRGKSHQNRLKKQCPDSNLAEDRKLCKKG